MKWDLFLSYASEDRSLARDLAGQLEARGVRVWFDRSSLQLGDSLRRSIDHGLANSRFGLVIISRHFFEKEWTKKELEGLYARDDGSTRIVLPLWHGVDAAYVREFSPTLADKLAISTELGVAAIVPEILRAIGVGNPDRLDRGEVQQRENLGQHDPTGRMMPATTYALERTSLGADEKAALKEAFESMPRGVRRIVELRVYSNMKYNEIAHMLGVSIDTVKSSLTLGQKHIKEALSDFLRL